MTSQSVHSATNRWYIFQPPSIFPFKITSSCFVVLGEYAGDPAKHPMMLSFYVLLDITSYYIYIYTHIFPIPTWFMIQVERIQTVRLRLLGLHLRYRISGAEGVAGSCYLAERRWFLKHLRDVPARLIPGPQGPRANPKLRKNCDYLDDFGRLFTRILHIFPEHIHFRWSVSEYLQIEAIPESVVRPCSPRKVIFAAQKDVT